MQGSYDPKEVVGFEERSLTCPALDSFVNTVKEMGIGYLVGVIRAPDETEEEYEQRIIEAKKGIF